MKKTLLVALVAMSLVACKEQEKKVDAATDKQDVEVVAEADVAFVNVDYVMTQSDIFQTEGIALRNKTEKAQQKLSKREQNLQNEMQQLADKYQRGLITTRDAQQKEKELQDKAANFQTSAQKEIKELDEEGVVFQNRMNDLIMRAVQAINADKQYKMIVQASALLDADESLNLTEQVLAKVNELYAEEKSEKNKK